MAIAPVEAHQEPAGFLASVQAALQDFSARFQQDCLLQSPKELAATVAGIEEISKSVEQLQVIGAHAVEQQNIAQTGETDQRIPWADPVQGTGQDGKPKKPEYKDAAEYLRQKLKISRGEAKRRLRVGSSTMPSTLITGEQAPPKLERLGAALTSSKISGQAATLIRDALERVRPTATPAGLAAMENQLTQQATESDIDGLREIIKRWEAVLDPDGLEPTDEILRAKQGVFLRGKRHGLHRLEIAATPEQFEYLVTVMNAATNPRVKTTFASEDGTPAAPATAADTPGGTADTAGAGPEQQWQGPTRPQKLLQGLVGACQIALSTDKLPSSGGHRPQIMINLDYQDLVDQIGASADAVFGGLISPKTVRKIACDADLIPLVLGGKGEILDIGRAQRLFTPAQRRALVARDKGCAFPDCTMPAPWTEAHHIKFWEKHNGPTSVHNGCLLCSYHHHLLHDENWIIEIRDGIPWFIPPRYIDPDQKPRRNRYRLAGTPLPGARAQAPLVENGTVAEPPPQPAELSLVPGSGPPGQQAETLLPLMEPITDLPPSQPKSAEMPIASDVPQKSKLSNQSLTGDGPDDWNRPFDDWPLQPTEPPW
ncbi:DUF222 domain-containing protein [Crystallibacter degradans]|uniref:DUF222 domain-containing protein n=1 Tax=Crystallibacter degradans TaxID=2726743 RepID=UPI001475A272|nr:DUF222 domain-containing protein [Arthrobacter sp. SF27]NMR28695.1 DUF222 domain-containing protein [Arthrobacter sp. SF27]